MRNQTWHYDVIGGTPLPNCPYASSSIPPSDGGSIDGGRPLYHNPSTSSTLFLLALTHLIFTLLTIFKYCQVKIFNRVIKHPSVSNYYFASFSALLAMASVIDGVRYSLDFPHQAIENSSGLQIDSSTMKITFFKTKKIDSSDEEERYIVGPDVMDSWLLLGSFIFRSGALYFLTLSLNHQRIHRSLVVPVTPLSISHHPRISDNESTPLLVNSPGFDATPVTEAPETDLEEGAGNASASEEENASLVPPLNSDRSTLLSQHFSLIQTKLAIISHYFFGLYSTLHDSGWLFPIIAFLAAVIRITTLLSIIDPARLSDYPRVTGNSDAPFFLSIAVAIIQIAPVIFLIIRIMCPGRTANSSSLMDGGPTLVTRFLLLVSLACTFAFWLEPSIICRLVTSFVLSNSQAVCIVPPWWWQKVKGFSTTIIPAHGWASILDLFMWIGGLGVFGLFTFMKIEYNRNADQWIAATVSEVQSTFGFY